MTLKRQKTVAINKTYARAFEIGNDDVVCSHKIPEQSTTRILFRTALKSYRVRYCGRREILVHAEGQDHNARRRQSEKITNNNIFIIENRWFALSFTRAIAPIGRVSAAAAAAATPTTPRDQVLSFRSADLPAETERCTAAADYDDTRTQTHAERTRRLVAIASGLNTTRSSIVRLLLSLQ